MVLTATEIFLGSWHVQGHCCVVAVKGRLDCWLHSSDWSQRASISYMVFAMRFTGMLQCALRTSLWCIGPVWSPCLTVLAGCLRLLLLAVRSAVAACRFTLRLFDVEVIHTGLASGAASVGT
jgi:hypothetical protein